MTTFSDTRPAYHRSAALDDRAMAATSHPLATQAALDALRAGGNAVDAALAASAVLAVVEPHMTGIGGDCFALIAEPDGNLRALNGSGRSGRLADVEIARARSLAGSRIPEHHGLAVTVPGAVRAWADLAPLGRRGLAAALAPAIDIARDGFRVTQWVARDWALLVDRLRQDEHARAQYLIADQAPGFGDRIALPSLARTLEVIAREGADAFYQGEIAADIVAAVEAAGGVLDLEDLAHHRSEWVEPLSREYRGRRVVEMPPANQGLTALVLMGILERFDLSALDPTGADKFHLEVEAARLAYAERDATLADPTAMQEPADAFLEAARLDRLASQIDPARAGGRAPAARVDTDTVYLTVVDEDGRAVSFINSLFTGFGSGICTASGVMLQSRGAGFVLDADHPNALGPQKRPLHTLIPGLLFDGDRLEASFGVMGGQYQACGHAHLLTNLLDHGLDPQAALDAPRVFFEGPQTVLEPGVAAAVRADLAGRGHDLQLPNRPLGGGQVIRVDHARGVLLGGSDSRKDGLALGLGAALAQT
ncbi:MAG: gamma-glutamyltransferase family protein [Pseudomonadota bacterium]